METNTLSFPKKGITHAGKFHADDVFSTALLMILNPEYTVERTNTVPENFDGIVYDIGLGEFDHHQADRRVRKNKIPYAAFGLLWEKFGKTLLPGNADLFDEQFVQPLDLSDNTGATNQLADAIDQFNPPWDASPIKDYGFFEAVALAKAILEKAIIRYESKTRAKSLVETALSQAKDHIMILPMSMPWKDFITEDIYFVIYPSARGGYNAQAVDKDASGAHRCEYPSSWYGLSDDNLKKVSGNDSLRFCHKSGFLLAGDSLEGVLSACYLALENMKASH